MLFAVAELLFYCRYLREECVLQWLHTRVYSNCCSTGTWNKSTCPAPTGQSVYEYWFWLAIVLLKAAEPAWWSMSADPSCHPCTALSSMTRWREASCSSRGLPSPLLAWRPNSVDLSSRKPRRRLNFPSGTVVFAVDNELHCLQLMTIFAFICTCLLVHGCGVLILWDSGVRKFGTPDSDSASPPKKKSGLWLRLRAQNQTPTATVGLILWLVTFCLVYRTWFGAFVTVLALRIAWYKFTYLLTYLRT